MSADNHNRGRQGAFRASRTPLAFTQDRTVPPYRRQSVSTGQETPAGRQPRPPISTSQETPGGRQPPSSIPPAATIPRRDENHHISQVMQMCSKILEEQKKMKEDYRKLGQVVGKLEEELRQLNDSIKLHNEESFTIENSSYKVSS